MLAPCRLACASLLAFAAVAAALPPPKAQPADGKLPLSGLAPAKILPNLCLLEYRVSTSSPECQALVNQGLGFFYSYVWMEAARSFETAARYDPDCAMAWWGLSRALEQWGKGNRAVERLYDQRDRTSLQKAYDLRDRASWREQQLILARMQEKGLVPGLGDAEARKRAAVATLDNLLALHDDDQEGWYYRARLAGGIDLFGGEVGAVPFYKALLHVNPLHPGGNHELLHFYEKLRRPALGWVYAEGYIKSSPGIPHAFHMQAHLATRIGRWDKTSDRSARAIELERAYHREMNVKPKDDHQFGHHLETLTISLIHDGRFREAHAVREEAQAAGIHHWLPWCRLCLAERAWDDALKCADQIRRRDKLTASYLTALVYLKKGDAARAAPEVEVLRQAYQARKGDGQLEYRLWETQGLLLCHTGAVDYGLRLLARAAERSKSDYGHHAWGNGAYLMEVWGLTALQAGRADVTEEGLLEALAHDPGSVRAALGLQVLCERQGRTEEANRYAALARKCWRRAEVQSFDAELAALREERFTPVTQRAQRETPGKSLAASPEVQP
jgi:Tfp pilus assembly protein PilF